MSTASRLAYRPPFDWHALLGFLGPRAIDGAEKVAGGVYRRVFRHRGEPCVVEARDDPVRHRLVVTARGAEDRAGVRARLALAFDLAADPAAIAAVLGADPLLAPLVAARPGLRVPGCIDAFELAVRAVLGQQISVAGARTLAGRITARWGTPVFDGAWRLFPDAPALARAETTSVGVMPARARTLAALARAVADDPTFLARDPATVGADLEALPGIGPWTAAYVRLRALGDRDAFPASDLGLLKGAAIDGQRPSPRELARRAETWRPYRAYAALHLWSA